MEYTINYGLTSETMEFNCVRCAMDYADERAGNTEEPVEIHDCNNELVAKRAWCGCMDGIEDCENPIRFGNSGYYDDWQLDF